MATVASTAPVSNIAVAFAAQSASSTIPIPHDGTAAAGSGARAGVLPTPPNSISPTLPPHKHRPGLPATARLRSPLSPEMDIDLQDAVEHAAAQDQSGSTLSKEALAGLDATRQITAIMLAKHHLPGIILGHGAMPIREMMAHLTQTVPGFSGLPASKARRLVVAALEHRAGGGLNGEVKFEKVGWGRWSVAGHNSTARGVPIGSHGSSRSGPTPPASLDSAKAARKARNAYIGSWTGRSLDSPDEDMADRMSLDGSEDSASDTSDMDLEDDLDDETDEEDWSAMGPQALRQKRPVSRPVYRDYNQLSRSSGANFRAVSAQSVPTLHAGAVSPNPRTSTYIGNRGPATTTSIAQGLSIPAAPNAEREAIEALIAMGSM